MVAEVARRVDLNIVVCTGVWRQPPNLFQRLDSDAIADLFARDIEGGIGESGVRAGVIKLATQPTVDAVNEKMLRAGARAHRRTGVAHQHAQRRDHGVGAGPAGRVRERGRGPVARRHRPFRGQRRHGLPAAHHGPRQPHRHGPLRHRPHAGHGGARGHHRGALRDGLRGGHGAFARHELFHGHDAARDAPRDDAELALPAHRERRAAGAARAGA